ncbi:MAG: 8-oxo-dGTP diphosphatase MutT [Limisphaerales bacterium]
MDLQKHRPLIPVDVSAALLFHDGQLLIAQRRQESHLGGLWEFPGGKREGNETFEECLVREIREELGCQVSVGELFEEVTHEYPGKPVHLKFYICRLVSGEPKALECAALRWVRREELADYDFPAADARLLEKLRAWSF